MGLVLCQQYGSQQSVSELEIVIQKQCGIKRSKIKPNTVVPVISTVTLSVLSVNLASYTEKGVVDLMVMKNF